MTPLLTARSNLPTAVAAPADTLQNRGIGIVHLGLGAFHKAHQAVYTDTALARHGGDWRIAAVSLRSRDIPRQLAAQDGRFTLLERDSDGTHARVVGSIAKALSLGDDLAEVLRLMAAPSTRIVSITVTEKGYGIRRDTGGADMDNPVNVADMKQPQQPTGLLGLLTEALAQRRAAQIPPFTILSCDNLPGNGAMVRKGLIDFARRCEPELADWIARNVVCPATMVDRITPAQTAETRALACSLTGYDDHAAVETEPFHQWVIEDDFPTGRPQWEAAGAIFTTDVAPFEHMKLRMLNGAHSMLAYAGFLAGHKYVRDVMQDPDLSVLVARHMSAAAATLPVIASFDFDAYAAELMARFRNTAIAHETYQIAMDGTQKMPQRIFAPAISALTAGQDARPFAVATAFWLRYCLGRTETGESYALRDPMEDAITPSIGGSTTAAAIVAKMFDTLQVVDAELHDHQNWRGTVTEVLDNILAKGVRATLKAEATRF